jgi:cation:H+ antiporter
MWWPRRTAETQVDEPEAEKSGGTRLAVLWLRFALLAALLAGAGYFVAEAGISISMHTSLSETMVGGLFTALSTALPELVTTIAAVRRGALTLAVSGVIGGNSFDVMLVAFSDFAYRQGSIYHALAKPQIFAIALTILMTAILVLGLLRRETHGIGNISFESFLILLLYLTGFSLLFFGS